MGGRAQSAADCRVDLADNSALAVHAGLRLRLHLYLGDQPAGSGFQPNELDPSCSPDRAPPAIAANEVLRLKISVDGQRDVDHDVDLGQRQLTRQHQAGRATAGNHYVVLVCVHQVTPG